MDIRAKIEEVMKDQEFVKSLAGLETVEEVADALKNVGVEISPEELEQARQVVVSSNGELNEDSLEAVSGGIGISSIVIGGIAIWTAISAVGGALDALKKKCK